MERRARGISAGRTAAQIALLPLGAFAVHQLRYLLAFGGHASAVLAQTGHSYLSSLAPWAILPLALLAGGFLRSLGRAAAGHTSARRYSTSLAGLWLACSLALVAIYAGQELLEGIVLAGHPAGFAGVFGFGGWWAIPAAAAVGLVVATLLHGALWVLREVARLRGGPRPAGARSPQRLAVCRADDFARPLSPLVEGWSGRGPPARSPVSA
jgi:hypothetical protein